MMEIQQLITSIVRVTQENDILIKELEGEVAQVQIQVTSIDTDLANLHAFCKVGKQCAKQCYFPPELFGGVKSDCAEYYHSNYWQQAGNPSEWFGMPQSGIYIIQPNPNLTPKYAYCDQKTDGGGWTLLQHKVCCTRRDCGDAREHSHDRILRVSPTHQTGNDMQPTPLPILKTLTSTEQTGINQCLLTKMVSAGFHAMVNLTTGLVWTTCPPCPTVSPPDSELI